MSMLILRTFDKDNKEQEKTPKEIIAEFVSIEDTYEVVDYDESLLVKDFPYDKGEQLSAQDTLDLFEDMIKPKDGRSQYYAGITNDIERREDEHNANDIFVVKAKNVDSANRLEVALKAADFDTGGSTGNAWKRDSVNVYVYKKGPETKE